MRSSGERTDVYIISYTIVTARPSSPQEGASLTLAPIMQVSYSQLSAPSLLKKGVSGTPLGVLGCMCHFGTPGVFRGVLLLHPLECSRSTVGVFCSTARSVILHSIWHLGVLHSTL